MEQGKTSMVCAGIDVAKTHLDAAVHGGAQMRFANDAEGIAALGDWLAGAGVTRVGLEATGGYERQVRTGLGAGGFEVVVHQPLEVRLFARLKRKRAKNDKADARIIAAATLQVDALRAAADPRFGELAERMTAYEQAADLLAQARTYREHTTLEDLRNGLADLIAALARRKAALLKDLLGRIRKESDLKERLKLLMSLSGFGQVAAAGMLIRMPELGAMKHGQAASLIGVAPFDRDSGEFRGMRLIGGGRSRPRRLLYMAALAARRTDPGLKAFADRLASKGKPPKLILTAIMRKLIEAANLVLKRGTPYLPKTP